MIILVLARKAWLLSHVMHCTESLIHFLQQIVSIEKKSVIHEQSLFVVFKAHLCGKLTIFSSCVFYRYNWIMCLTFRAVLWQEIELIKCSKLWTWLWTLRLFFLEPGPDGKKKGERLFLLMETHEPSSRTVLYSAWWSCGKGHQGWMQTRFECYIIVFE